LKGRFQGYRPGTGERIHHQISRLGIGFYQFAGNAAFYLADVRRELMQRAFVMGT
jgi:hypothetical protein